MRPAALGGGACVRQERQQFICSTGREGRGPGGQGEGMEGLPIRGGPFWVI